MSTQSNNSSSNVVVVCVGNSFKTKCFATANSAANSSASTSLNDNLSPSTKLNQCNYSTSTATTNNKLNQSVENNNESRINCQMNNLLEEDEDELEGVKIDDANNIKESPPTGTHLSTDSYLKDENNQNQIGDANGDEPPQSLIINCVNGLKPETCVQNQWRDSLSYSSIIYHCYQALSVVCWND